uniref:Uncharacterized protein n=1 Tax=Branchiostoma floridae TaxID=7739 RepID=C3ZJR2_BRAFL|eukprot:XP_002591186.1 hypothetical protein BRAFLDRAFT_105388 [Branchiostoma floridae]
MVLHLQSSSLFRRRFQRHVPNTTPSTVSARVAKRQSAMSARRALTFDDLTPNEYPPRQDAQSRNSNQRPIPSTQLVFSSRIREKFYLPKSRPKQQTIVAPTARNMPMSIPVQPVFTTVQNAQVREAQETRTAPQIRWPSARPCQSLSWPEQPVARYKQRSIPLEVVKSKAGLSPTGVDLSPRRVNRNDTYGRMLLSPIGVTLTRGKWHSLSLDIGFMPCYDQTDVPIMACVSSIMGLVRLKGIYVHQSIHRCDGNIIRIHITNQSSFEEIVVHPGQAIGQIFFVSSADIGLDSRIQEPMIVACDTALTKHSSRSVRVEPLNKEGAICHDDEIPIVYPFSNVPIVVAPMERFVGRYSIPILIHFNMNSPDDVNDTMVLKRGSLVACVRYTRLANVKYL